MTPRELRDAAYRAVRDDDPSEIWDACVFLGHGEFDLDDLSAIVRALVPTDTHWRVARTANGGSASVGMWASGQNRLAQTPELALIVAAIHYHADWIERQIDEKASLL